MAWNGSDNEKVKVEGQGQQRSGKNSSVHLFSPPSPKFNYKALVAGLIVVIGGGLAAWMMMRGETGESGERGEIKASRIAEVAPAVVTNVVEDAPARAKPSKKKRYWETDNTNGFTECMLEKWKQMRRPAPKMTNDYFVVRPRERFEIFPTRAENEIAMLLTMEPGSTLVGSPNYGPEFKKEFLASCQVPIVTSPDDDEYTRDLKKMMNETKIELMNRHRNGEDICEIMAESRNEMQRLYLVRQELENMAHQMISEKAETEEDVDTIVQAVDKMMEEKGLAPISLSPISKRCIMRRLGISPNSKENTK